MDTKTALLEVTARLFADHGWRGTTTRRIAEVAGVNEVTVFRLFRSKEALLTEAIRVVASEAHPDRLPAEPGAMRPELLAWGKAQHDRLRRKGSMIRTCLAEFEEHPELAPVACEGAMQSMADAIRYFTLARERGLIGPDGSLEAATVMLMNAIFMDAITRDVVPDCQPVSPVEAIGAFVDLTLRALDAREAA
jgi:AcrR family transcriptional regulator